MQNVKELRERISRAASALLIKCLLITGEKRNIVSMCVVPLTVPILSSTEYIRNFVRSNV
jgi:hypothetical protein